MKHLRSVRPSDAPRTTEQSNRFHKLLSILHIDKDQKAELVEGISQGRTCSSADLTEYEMDTLNIHLQKLVNEQPDIISMNKMKGKIFSCLHELGWEKQGGKVDIARFEAWLLKFGYLHKKLDEYTIKELPRLVTQVESMLTKKYQA